MIDTSKVGLEMLKFSFSQSYLFSWLDHMKNNSKHIFNLLPHMLKAQFNLIFIFVTTSFILKENTLEYYYENF